MMMTHAFTFNGHLLSASLLFRRSPSVSVCTTRADRIVTVAVHSSINGHSSRAPRTPPTIVSSVSVTVMPPSADTVPK